MPQEYAVHNGFNIPKMAADITQNLAVHLSEEEDLQMSETIVKLEVIHEGDTSIDHHVHPLQIGLHREFENVQVLDDSLKVLDDSLQFLDDGVQNFTRQILNPGLNSTAEFSNYSSNIKFEGNQVNK